MTVCFTWALLYIAAAVSCCLLVQRAARAASSSIMLAAREHQLRAEAARAALLKAKVNDPSAT
jgi:hypothetical protein